jgi:hypothetical protein
LGRCADAGVAGVGDEAGDGEGSQSPRIGNLKKIDSLQGALSQTTMQEYASLIQAIAALLWPLFAFTALFVFRSQIADIARRLKKGKLFGQEVELEESLDRLTRSAESATSEVAALLPAPATERSTEQVEGEEVVVRRILSEAARSPKAALISLSSELERLAREVLATTGHLNGRRVVPVQQAITELHHTYGLPSHVPSSLEHFWDVRNRVVHRGEGTNEDILRAIDSGVSILRALQAMPRETHVVCDPDVRLFGDEELKHQIEHVHGVLLEALSPGGASRSLRIYPSTRTHFARGKRVSWEWNMGVVVGPAWYRDAATGTSKQAWHSSAEFVGRHLDEL